MTDQTKIHQTAADHATQIARARINPISQQVKMADLADNMDLSRLPAPTARDLERIKKYEAVVALLRAEDERRGNPRDCPP